jgi:pyruvate formate lyase activating enzyme
MKIGGYQKSSLTDFPGKVAAVVFTQGCGWRCPFCHNRSLVHPARFQPAIPEEEVFDHLELRRDQLDGVVVTGGEPTLQPGLPDFLRRVRKLGYAIKLETNGGRPSVISQLLLENLVDYVAMDVKGPLSDYKRFTGCEVDTGLLELSIELIKQSNIAYEFRTTLVGGLHTPEHIDELAPLLYGVRRYAVQTYRMPPSDFRSQPPFTPPNAELFHAASVALRDHVDEFLVR